MEPEVVEFDSELDIRVVTIMWVGDAEYPEVNADGCSSVYEAEGMCRAAAGYLARLGRIPLRVEDDEDE